MSRHVVITGPMGVGKSTTADGVASLLGLPHRDSDDEIEAVADMTGKEIAETKGVGALHALEAEVCLRSLAEDRPSVISAAASVVDSAECRAALLGAFVVSLELGIDELEERVAQGDHRRAMPREELEEAMGRRAPLLREIADLTLDASRSPTALASAVVSALRGSADQAPTRDPP